MNKRRVLQLVALLLSSLAVGAGQVWADEDTSQTVEQGRYLVMIAGCNDCHTSGYLLSAGKIPEDQWLTGDSFGWRGPWGTTYPPNLRMLLKDLTEEQWLALARNLEARPPMPWYNLNIMKVEDLRAIYKFIRKLGPGGSLAPGYLPPDQEPAPPYALFPLSPPKK
jgi:mono/diheme cytochrome c family protein